MKISAHNSKYIENASKPVTETVFAEIKTFKSL
jgi:hypothetical protein